MTSKMLCNIAERKDSFSLIFFKVLFSINIWKFIVQGTKFPKWSMEWLFIENLLRISGHLCNLNIPLKMAARES